MNQNVVYVPVSFASIFELTCENHRLLAFGRLQPAGTPAILVKEGDDTVAVPLTAFILSAQRAPGIIKGAIALLSCMGKVSWNEIEQCLKVSEVMTCITKENDQRKQLQTIFDLNSVEFLVSHAWPTACGEWANLFPQDIARALDEFCAKEFLAAGEVISH